MNIKENKKSILSAEQRLEKILELIASTGFGGVNELSKLLSVSEMTIRRDMEKLEAEGHIRRTHGGQSPDTKGLKDTVASPLCLPFFTVQITVQLLI